MAIGRNSFGSQIGFIASTLTTNLVWLAGIINIAPPHFTKNTIDVTNHGTTDNYQQVIPGSVMRSSPITIGGVYLSTDTAITATLPGAVDNRSFSTLVISIAGTSSMNQIVSEGYVTDYSITTPLDDKVTFDISFKPYGKPTVMSSFTTS